MVQHIAGFPGLKTMRQRQNQKLTFGELQ